MRSEVSLPSTLDHFPATFLLALFTQLFYIAAAPPKPEPNSELDVI